MKSARVLSRAERVRESQRITEQNILPNDVSLALDRREYPGQGERCGKGKSGVDVMRPQTVLRGGGLGGRGLGQQSLRSGRGGRPLVHLREEWLCGRDRSVSESRRRSSWKMWSGADKEMVGQVDRFKGHLGIISEFLYFLHFHHF